MTPNVRRLYNRVIKSIIFTHNDSNDWKLRNRHFRLGNKIFSAKKNKKEPSVIVVNGILRKFRIKPPTTKSACRTTTPTPLAAINSWLRLTGRLVCAHSRVRQQAVRTGVLVVMITKVSILHFRIRVFAGDCVDLRPVAAPAAVELVATGNSIYLW